MCRQLSLCFERPWRESAVERKWICRNWGARPSDQHLEQPDASIPQRVESNTSDMGINLQTPQHVAESGGTYCAANLACVKKKKISFRPIFASLRRTITPHRMLLFRLSTRTTIPQTPRFPSASRRYIAMSTGTGKTYSVRPQPPTERRRSRLTSPGRRSVTEHAANALRAA